MSEKSFDFWVGEWEVRWIDSEGLPQSGTNSVSRVDGTTRELFCAPEPTGVYIGASVSRWDLDAGAWIQDYWDNRAYAAIFRGSLSAGQMVLERSSQLGSGPLTRLVWSDIRPDSISWNYERRGESGLWESTWRIDYSRSDSKDSIPSI